MCVLGCKWHHEVHHVVDADASHILHAQIKHQVWQRLVLHRSFAYQTTKDVLAMVRMHTRIH
jgi:hypothetical protein